MMNRQKRHDDVVDFVSLPKEIPYFSVLLITYKTWLCQLSLLQTIFAIVIIKRPRL